MNPTPRALTRLTLGLLLLGLLWRTVRYFLAFPIWGDEAMLGLSIATLDHVQLTQRLENCQIAPLLFLWGERSVWSWLGSGELAMRLVPFLAGTLGLILFWRWARRLLDPLACLCAVGFLAVAIWPVSMCTLLKPYSCDLLFPLVLLVPATCWLQAPRPGWLVLLTVLVPVALLGSYPTVFVAGAVALALLVPAWRAGWTTRGWYLAYVLAMFAGFALSLQVGNNQLHSVTHGVETAAGMSWFWSESFPPDSPWKFPGWVLLQTAGQMTAYPVGGSNGASLGTVVVGILGAILLVRQRRFAILTLCVVPILLNLLAAFLHRYPYGAAGRLAQHLAPGICLLAGLGLAGVTVWLEGVFRCPGRGALRVAAVFALIGVVGLVRDVLRPYRDPGCVWMRDTMTAMRRYIPPGEPVVVCAPMFQTEAVFAWYWVNKGPRVGWDFAVPACADRSSTLWAYTPDRGEATCTRLEQQLGPDWRRAEHVPYVFHPGTEEEQAVALVRYVRSSPMRDPNALAQRMPAARR
jgi:hypothetical protein